MMPIVKGGVGSLVVHVAAFAGLLLWKPGGDDGVVIIDLTVMPAPDMPNPSVGGGAASTAAAPPPKAPVMDHVPVARASPRPTRRASAQVRQREVSSTPTTTAPESPASDSEPAPAAGAAQPSQGPTGPATPEPAAARSVPGGGGGVGSVAGPGAGSAQKSYLAAHYSYIREAIQRAAAYPSVARRMGWAGRVVLSFRILPDGAAANVRVAKGSGFAVLDAGAVEAVRRGSPFPRPPAEAELVVPVVFSFE